MRVKLPTSSAIYLIDPDGYRRLIPDSATYTNLFHSRDGIIVDINVSQIPEGSPFTAGAVLVKANSAVYLVSNAIKRWITAVAVMDKYHFSWKHIFVVPPVLVDSIPSGPNWS